MSALWSWLPTYDEFVDGLSFVDREKIGVHMVDQGVITSAEWAAISVDKHMSFFSDAAEFTGDHWIIPLVAVALYLVMIVVGPMIMANRSARRGARASALPARPSATDPSGSARARAPCAPAGRRSP